MGDSYALHELHCLELLLEVLDLALRLEGELLDVVLALLLELLELLVVLQRGLLEALRLQLQLRLQLVDLAAVELLQAGQLVPELVASDGQVLVLVQQVVDPELCLRERDLLPAELVLQLDQLVLELDPALALVVQIRLEAVLGLPELLALALQHELHLAHSSLLLGAVCVGRRLLLAANRL